MLETNKQTINKQTNKQKTKSKTDKTKNNVFEEAKPLSAELFCRVFCIFIIITMAQLFFLKLRALLIKRYKNMPLTYVRT